MALLELADVGAAQGAVVGTGLHAGIATHDVVERLGRPLGLARRLLRGYADDGRTVLVSSHILAEVSRLADDVVIIAGGRLVAQGSLAQLTEHGNLEETFLELTTTTGVPSR